MNDEALESICVDNIEQGGSKTLANLRLEWGQGLESLPARSIPRD
jgi:hypothetical protein